MRLGRVSAYGRPRWGQLTAPRMVAHLIDAARMALSEHAVPSATEAPRWLRLNLVKHAFVYRIPFPRNVRSAGELFATSAGDWQHDVACVHELYARLATRVAEGEPRWPEHPFLARCRPARGESWGIGTRIITSANLARSCWLDPPRRNPSP